MASTHETIIAELKRRGEVLVNMARQISGVELDYSGDSVAKLDLIIDDAWGGQVPGQLRVMVELFGSYIGEVFIRQLNGQWVEREGHWVVELPLPDGSSARANIFSKVEKRFLHGVEDSLGYYFSSMQKMQQGGLYGL